MLTVYTIYVCACMYICHGTFSSSSMESKMSAKPKVNIFCKMKMYSSISQVTSPPVTLSASEFCTPFNRGHRKTIMRDIAKVFFNGCILSLLLKGSLVTEIIILNSFVSTERPLLKGFSVLHNSVYILKSTFITSSIADIILR